MGWTVFRCRAHEGAERGPSEASRAVALRIPARCAAVRITSAAKYPGVLHRSRVRVPSDYSRACCRI